MRNFRCAVGLVLTLSGAAHAQPAAAPSGPIIADIHLTAPGTPGPSSGMLPNGRVEIRAQTVLQMITFAYNVQPDRVIGGPSWLDSTKFDVVAKAPSGTQSFQAILKPLLAERFKLVTHSEQRSVPVFALKVAKRSSQLKQSTSSVSGRCAGSPAMDCQNLTMGFLASMIQGRVGRPVVDATGLSGGYDFILKWNPNNDAGEGPVSAAIDQLGLKLEPTVRPIPFLVIDSMGEKPTDNPPDVARNIPTDRVEFDVVEFRASKITTAPAVGPGANFRITRNTFERFGASAKELLVRAFGLMREDMLVGAPKWTDLDHFDVIGKTSAPTGMNTMERMLRPVLVDRFKLAYHNEQQLRPGYALLAGTRRKLKAADPSARSGCKKSQTIMTCQNTTMAQLAEQLSAWRDFNYSVVDKTGIKGAYDFALSWVPQNHTATAGGRGEDPAERPAAATEATAPTGEVTMVEALGRQLGLKLEEQKTLQPVFVIDHIERPAPGK